MASLGVRLLRSGGRALSAVAPGLAARVAERLWFTPRHIEVSDEARAFLATGERLSLAVDGRSIVAWAWGAGRAVILMHGWGGHGAQMQPFVDPLVRAGFQAITFDAPAHGASGPSRLGTRRTTLFDFADGLNAVARETRSIAGIVAHSGACTAAAWALQQATLDQQIPRYARDDRMCSVPALVFISPMASPRRYRAMFQRMLGLSDEVMRRFSSNAERHLDFRWDDFEVPEMAARMKTPPVLVIHDRGDRETSPDDGAAIAAAWPNSRLLLTDGLGHVRILRDPAVVGEVVRFVETASS